MHLVMQQIDLTTEVTEAYLDQLKVHLVQNEFLRTDQLEAINDEGIIRFFETDVARRMRNASMIQRELPFSMGISAHEAYPNYDGPEETVLVQGVIDCLFKDEHGFVLLDYKTDSITGRFPNGYEEAKPVLEQRYKVQIDLYSRAIQDILKIKLDEKYLYFFDDGGHLLKM